MSRRRGCSSWSLHWFACAAYFTAAARSSQAGLIKRTLLCFTSTLSCMYAWYKCLASISAFFLRKIANCKSLVQAVCRRALELLHVCSHGALARRVRGLVLLQVGNMAYMARMGLWGPCSPFPDFAAFLESMKKRGVSFMELLAMEMKAAGRYMARGLSFRWDPGYRLWRRLLLQCMTACAILVAILDACLVVCVCVCLMCLSSSCDRFLMVACMGPCGQLQRMASTAWLRRVG